MLTPSVKFYCLSLLVVIIGLSGCSSVAPKPVVVDTQENTRGPIDPQLQQRFGDALVLLRDEQFVEAETAFLAMTADYPNYPGPWSNLAVAQNTLEKYEDALQSLDKALALDSAFCQALSLKGVSLRELGKFQEAKSQYEAALKCDPQDNLSVYNLGVLADLYLHDPALALAYYEEYLRRIATEPSLESSEDKSDEQDDVSRGNKDKTVSSWVIDLKRRVPEGTVVDISAIVNSSTATTDTARDTLTTDTAKPAAVQAGAETRANEEVVQGDSTSNDESAVIEVEIEAETKSKTSNEDVGEQQ